MHMHFQIIDLREKMALRQARHDWLKKSAAYLAADRAARINQATADMLFRFERTRNEPVMNAIADHFAGR